jgi:hypothetical protein
MATYVSSRVLLSRRSLCANVQTEAVTSKSLAPLPAGLGEQPPVAEEAVFAFVAKPSDAGWTEEAIEWLRGSVGEQLMHIAPVGSSPEGKTALMLDSDHKVRVLRVLSAPLS